MAVTIWIEQSPTQADKAYLLTDLDEILTNEDDDRIVFSNWDFYDSNTQRSEDTSF